MYIIPGFRPVLGTSFVWPPPAACCRCRLQRSDEKKAPRAQGAFCAEGSGCLCVLMARAWRLVLHEAFAASHSPPHTQAAGMRALLPPGQCAAWQQAGMRGLAPPRSQPCRPPGQRAARRGEEPAAEREECFWGTPLAKWWFHLRGDDVFPSLKSPLRSEMSVTRGLYFL